jgi:hypothetical protein
MTVMGLSRDPLYGFQDSKRFVEFQRKLDLCVIEQGDGCIHLVTARI